MQATVDNTKTEKRRAFIKTPPYRKIFKLYPNNLKSREFDKERALNLSQAQPAPKQLNLNKLSDAGGSQIEWLPTPSKTAFSGCLGIYRNNLKNREFGKEGPQNFASERATIAQWQGASEKGNSEANPTRPKTDSSSCFGIYKYNYYQT